MSAVLIICIAMLIASALIWLSSFMASGWVAERRIRKIIEEVEKDHDL